MNKGTLNTGLAWMAVLCLIPLLSWSQVPEDSLKENRDSIQDARMDRMERRTERRLDQVEGDQETFDGSIDSIGVILDSFRHHLEWLDLEEQSQSEKLLLLGEELEATRESSRIYLERLKVILWISGIVILVMLSASFVILLIYGLKTRHLLYRLRWKQKQIRKELTDQKKKIRVELKAAKKTAKKKK